MAREPDSCPYCGSLAFKTIWTFYSSTHDGWFNLCHSCDKYSVWRGSIINGIDGENKPTTVEEQAFINKVNEVMRGDNAWKARALTHKELLMQRWGDTYNHVEDVPIEIWLAAMNGRVIT